jgi:hypothetical protein
MAELTMCADGINGLFGELSRANLTAALAQMEKTTSEQPTGSGAAGIVKAVGSIVVGAMALAALL